MIRHLVKIFLLFGSLCQFGYAADPIFSIPNVSDPGVVQKRLQSEFLPSPQSTAVIHEKKAPEAQPIAAAEKIKFTLNKVEITGNKVYSTAELETIFQPYLHKTISLAQLQNLVNEITVKYRSAGYILSRAFLPPQTIAGGVVKVQVVEGYISKVTVTGDRSCSTPLIEKMSQEITQQRPLKINTLEHDLLLMNDLPGISVKSVITPSKNIPGSADLTLVTEYTPFNAYASYDNFGTRYLGPNQLTVSGSFNSVWTAGDSNTIHAVDTPSNDSLHFIELIRSQPLGTHGTRLTLDGNYTETHPFFLLQPFDVRGRNFLVFGDIYHPLIRSRSKNFAVHATANYQNVVSTILTQPFYDDRFRTLVLGGNFDNSDSWYGTNAASLNLEHGFNIMGADKHFFQSRPLGVPNFTKVNISASRNQGFKASRFSLYGALDSQYSCNPLLATEQYSFGGPIFGRGYDPSEIIGDSAIAGKIELRANTFPEWRFLQAVQYYVFYDAGMIWNRDGVNLPAKQSATSTGVGVRISFMPEVQGQAFIGKPLTHNVAVLRDLGENPRGARLFFQIVAQI